MYKTVEHTETSQQQLKQKQQQQQKIVHPKMFYGILIHTMYSRVYICIYAPNSIAKKKNNLHEWYSMCVLLYFTLLLCGDDGLEQQVEGVNNCFFLYVKQKPTAEQKKNMKYLHTYHHHPTTPTNSVIFLSVIRCHCYCC